MRQKRRSYREPDDDEDASGEDLAAVNERLDALTRQLERMAQAKAEPRGAAGGTDERADRVTDALARLDRRLDQVIQESRTTAIGFQQRPRYAPPPCPAIRAPLRPPPPPPPAAPRRGPANWAAQISARQRALDGGPPAPRLQLRPHRRIGGADRTLPAWSNSFTTSTRRFPRCISPTRTRLARCEAIWPRSGGR